jgi:hypothetical protein
MTADTGRPVKGARVNLSGVLGAATRMGGPAPVPSTTGPGAPSGGIPGSTLPSGRGRGGEMFVSGVSRVAITDAQGSFSFERIPGGRYTLNVNRQGFLNTTYGQKKPGGTGSTLTIEEGQKSTIELRMLRGGVISGTVFGEDGDPLSNTYVNVWRFTNQNGVKRLSQNNGASTDDRGMYRIHNLQPGDYLVSATYNNFEMNNDRMLADMAAIERAIASGAIQPPAGPGQPATVTIPVQPMPSPSQPREGPPPGYLPVYHPSTAVPMEGTIVKVAGGDEHTSVDIQVRMVQASNIQGTVTNMPGAGVGVQLALVNDDPMFSNQSGTRVEPNGNFVFRNVAPGKYTIVAQTMQAPTYTIVNGVSTQPTQPPPPLTDEQKLWGRTVVAVEGQPSIDASVTLRRGRTISGQVHFDMQRPPDVTRTKWMITLAHAPGVQPPSYGQMPQAEVGPDGRFTLTAVPAGVYQLRAGGSLKSVIVNGEDILDVPLNFNGLRDITDVLVTVTDKTTHITGLLTDAAGKPGTDYSVVAVTEDPRFWTPGSRRIAMTRPSPEGRYAFNNLPPGTYMLAAVADLEFGGQYDPEFLKSLAASAPMRVTLAEGQRVTQDLRMR